MSLFEETKPPKPLAERMRPTNLDEIIGQDQAIRLLEAFVQRGQMPSVVFSGPPGSGKTTMSRLMASLLGWEGRSLNATSASVKDIRELAAEAKEIWRQMETQTLLFIDEIHRLNKGQQDVLLPFLEEGTVVLAGSTTENPFFALNQALRSRVQLIRLEPLSAEMIRTGLMRACQSLAIEPVEDVIAWIAERVAGDLRLALTTLESTALMAEAQTQALTIEAARLCLNRTQLAGDRKGDNHYDLASAYQKSMRGSDIDAAVYYLTRFLETGEDPRFIARRLLICASEDVGNADPQALLIAGQAFRAVEVLGLPECQIPLAQATIYVARAPKSNEAIQSLSACRKILKENALPSIPPHLRDSHYPGAAALGHGKGYLYSHDHPEAAQTFLPEPLVGTQLVPAQKRPSNQIKIPEEDLTRLLALLKDQVGPEEEWFEIQAGELAGHLGWEETKVRAATNRLVQDKRLRFVRRFQLS